MEARQKKVPAHNKLLIVLQIKKQSSFIKKLSLCCKSIQNEFF